MRYLKGKDGYIFVWTPELAKRGDLEEVEDLQVSQELGAEQGAVAPNAGAADMTASESGVVGTPLTAEELEGLAWQHVKTLVLERGGEWTNKADGISFLTKAE